MRISAIGATSLLRRWARAARPLLGGLSALGIVVSRDDVVWCYRQLLGRDPESEDAILAHRRFFSFRSLVQNFMASPEYAGRSAAPATAAALAGDTQVPAPAWQAAIQTYLQHRPAGPELRVYIATHAERLHHALNVVARAMPNGGGLIDYSAAGFFSHAVRQLLPAVVQTSITGVNFELDDYAERYGTQTYDLCLNTEVLEHLLYDPSHMVFSINRMLKHGGHLFLSTPNALAMTSTVKMLTGHGPGLWTQLKPKAPYYERHNREWTPFEVSRLLEEHGFEIVQLYTANFYEASRKLLERHEARSTLIRNQSTHSYHGDTLCVLARKARAVPAPVHNPWLYAEAQQP